MKTLFTLLLIIAAFWLGTHFVIVPRLDAAVTPAHSAARHGAVAKAKPAVKPAPAPQAEKESDPYVEQPISTKL